MVRGIFIDQYNLPVVSITVAWGNAVQSPSAVLDTGFSGDLQVTPQIALELGLVTLGVTPTRIANGETVQVPTALAYAAMEGAVNLIQVLISESFPLVGIGFLTKFNYKAVVDCKYKTVELEKVV